MKVPSSLLDIIQCPICGNNLTSVLKCPKCGRKYSLNEGIHFLFDSETSSKEWKWDERVLSEEFREWIKQAYSDSLSDEVKNARETWFKVAGPILNELSGIVVDIASGLGTMLEAIIPLGANMLIASDVDPNVLLSTKRELEKKFENHAVYLSFDAKHIPIRDDIVDYVTSLAGTNNIKEPEKALREFHRILKPEGKAILMTSFVESGTATDKATQEYGFGGAYVKDEFVSMLRDVGFRSVETIEASSATWNENEMDLFPIAGDQVHFSVVKAMK